MKARARSRVVVHLVVSELQIASQESGRPTMFFNTYWVAAQIFLHIAVPGKIFLILHTVLLTNSAIGPFFSALEETVEKMGRGTVVSVPVANYC